MYTYVYSSNTQQVYVQAVVLGTYMECSLNMYSESTPVIKKSPTLYMYIIIKLGLPQC